MLAPASALFVSAVAANSSNDAHIRNKITLRSAVLYRQTSLQAHVRLQRYYHEDKQSMTTCE